MKPNRRKFPQFHSFHRTPLASVLAMATFFTVAAPTTQAGPNDIAVNSATADFTTGNLTVLGANMVAPDKSHPLVVLLNNMSLTIASSTPTMLMATLPAGLTAGSYHLVVGNGNPSDPVHNGFLDVTLGTTGPQGPKGDTGPAGGASDVFFNRNFQNVPMAGSSTPTTVATLSLPPGTYVLHAKLRYRNNGSAGTESCAAVFFGQGIGGLDSSQNNVPPGGENTQVDGVMMDFVTKNVGDYPFVYVHCFGPSDTSVINTQFEAVRSKITFQ